MGQWGASLDDSLVCWVPDYVWVHIWSTQTNDSKKTVRRKGARKRKRQRQTRSSKKKATRSAGEAQAKAQAEATENPNAVSDSADTVDADAARVSLTQQRSNERPKKKKTKRGRYVSLWNKTRTYINVWSYLHIHCTLRHRPNGGSVGIRIERGHGACGPLAQGRTRCHYPRRHAEVVQGRGWNIRGWFACIIVAIFINILPNVIRQICQFMLISQLPHPHHHLQKLEIADAQQRSMLELLLQNKSTVARRERLAYLRNAVRR